MLKFVKLSTLNVVVQFDSLSLWARVHIVDSLDAVRDSCGAAIRAKLKARLCEP
jgi:hypothetical protein